MVRQILLFWVVVGLFPFAKSLAQQADPKPLECVGPIPEVIRQRATTAFEKNKAQTIDQTAKRKDRKTQADFALKSAFGLDATLNSGRVLFGDPVTVYINKVADRLLASDAALRAKLQFFTVRSPYVNAFATDQGVIFVNLGLMAQIENEAQLAFILAHEVAHYVKKHNLSVFMEKTKIAKGQGEYRNAKISERLLSYHSFSKEVETEADDYGFELYQKSGYSMAAINGVFDVLLYSYLPTDEVPFDHDFFHMEHCKLPHDYFPDSVNAIKAAEDYDDSESTHPNIKKRRENMFEKTGKEVKDDKPLFLVGENDFKTVQHTARHELSRLFFSVRHYEKAIYNAYLILKQGESQEQQRIIMKSLYGLAVYKDNNNLEEAHLREHKTEGELHALVHLIDKLSLKELNVLALNQALAYQKKYPSDAEADKIIRELCYRLADLEEMGLEDFAAMPPPPDTPADSAATETKTEEKSSSKYQKIKEKKKVIEKAEIFPKYALVPYIQDPNLKKYLDEGKKIRDKKYRDLSKLSRKERNEIAKEEKRNQKAGTTRAFGASYIKQGFSYHSMKTGIDKIVLVNPDFTKIDERKNDEVKLLDSEAMQEVLTDRILKMAAKANLETILLDAKQLKANETESFNAMMLMKEAVNEKFIHADVDSILPGQPDRIAALQNKFQTPYFAFIGVQNVRLKKSVGHKLGTTIMFFYPILWPIAIARVAMPLYRTSFYTLVYDMSNSRLVYLATPATNMNQSKTLLDIYLYDNFLTIKNLKQPRKK